MQELYGQFYSALEGIVKNIAQELLEKRAEEIRKEIETARQVLSNITVKVEDPQARAEVERLDKELTAISRSTERLQEYVMKEVQKIISQVEGHELKFDIVKTSVEEGFSRVDKALKEITGKVSESINKLQGGLKEHEKVLFNVNTAIKEIIERLKKKFAEFTDGINSAVESINRLWDTVENLQKQFAEERALREDLQKQLAEERTLRGNMQKTILLQESKIEELSKENHWLKAETVRLSEELIKQKEKSERLEKENLELRKDTEKLYQALESLLLEVKGLKKGYEELKKDMDKNASKTEALRRDITDQRKRLLAVEQGINEVNAMLYALTQRKEQEQKQEQNDILSP
ncbi:MAG: hypothetical protein QXM53_09035 [Thermofilaceae archaeon]